MKFWCNKFTVWNWKSLDFILFHYSWTLSIKLLPFYSCSNYSIYIPEVSQSKSNSQSFGRPDQSSAFGLFGMVARLLYFLFLMCILLAYKLVTFYIKFLIIKLISFSSYVFFVAVVSLMGTRELDFGSGDERMGSDGWIDWMEMEISLKSWIG